MKVLTTAMLILLMMVASAEAARRRSHNCTPYTHEQEQRLWGLCSRFGQPVGNCGCDFEFHETMLDVVIRVAADSDPLVEFTAYPAKSASITIEHADGRPIANRLTIAFDDGQIGVEPAVNACPSFRSGGRQTLEVARGHIESMCSEDIQAQATLGRICEHALFRHIEEAEEWESELFKIGTAVKIRTGNLGEPILVYCNEADVKWVRNGNERMSFMLPAKLGFVTRACSTDLDGFTRCTDFTP